MAVAIEQLNLLPMFDAVYGSSAGALNAAWLLCGQAEKTMHAWWDPTVMRGTIDPRRALRRQPVVDTRFLVHTVYTEIMIMGFQEILDSPIEFHPLATDALILNTERKSGAALKLMFEAEPLIQQGDPDADMAESDVWGTIGIALIQLNDLEGAAEAFDKADFVWADKAYPRPDFDDVYNMAVLAAQLGEADLARDLAAAHHRLAARSDLPHLDVGADRFRGEPGGLVERGYRVGDLAALGMGGGHVDQHPGAPLRGQAGGVERVARCR